MPAGATHSTYASLLARGRLFRRLQPLARFFDYIIVDAGSLTPSLLARVSDGADNVLVAVRQHVSSMHELSSMVRTLREETVPEPCVLMIE
jgi:cellulose biosynthesis protein BcsQ